MLRILVETNDLYIIQGFRRVILFLPLLYIYPENNCSFVLTNYYTFLRVGVIISLCFTVTVR